MPTVTSNLTNTNQDGHSYFSQNQSDAWDVNDGRTTITPFYGPNGSNPNLVYFCFNVVGVPQGADLDRVDMTVHMQNGPYSNGSSSRIYVAVENNLQTQPGVGAGAITRGTRGRTPWDRLGRIAQAVTAYGNRCGPTHSHPSGLSGYGANVRDPYAHVLKAFCSDQGTASAVGRTMTTASGSVGGRHTTENFASALQPLVNDPSWSESSQWVMVYLFSDSTAASSTTWGVGNLVGIEYLNGMRPSTLTTTGQGTISMYNGSVPNSIATLSVEYTSIDLSSKSGKSVSFGYSSLRGRPKPFGIMRNERIEQKNFGQYLPGDGGALDLPPYGVYMSANPLDPAWTNANGTPGFQSRVRLDPTRRVGRVDGHPIHFDNEAGMLAYARWKPDQYLKNVSSLHTYSLRFYHSYDYRGVAPRGDTINNVVKFDFSNSESFRVRLEPFEIGFLTWNWKHRINASSGGTSSSLTSTQITRQTASNFYRYELQVSEYATPKVRMRVYDGDSTTPIDVLYASPTSVQMDTITFGIPDSSQDRFFAKISDVELWDDYNLGRQFPDTTNDLVPGTPYVPQEWSWFDFNGTGFDEMQDLGTVSAIEPDGSGVVLDSSQALSLEDNTGWLASDSTFTKYSDLAYGTGTRRVMDLYVPDGTPPVGGWPVVMFSHGGFFIDGDKSVVSPDLVNLICNHAKCALASINYVLCAVADSLGTYPTYNPSTASGKYPSFFLNFKEATYWLKTNASTYGLNANKFIAAGQSAGGYIALAAAVSRGVTADGGGRNLTLAGNTSGFFTPNVPDPAFVGVIAWSPPVSLNSLKLYDPTWHHGKQYALPGSGAGVMETTSRLFMGQPADGGASNTNHTAVSDLIRINAANVPPIAHFWGDGDFLVPSNPLVNDSYNQDLLLSNAISDVAGSLPGGFFYESIRVPNALHHTICTSDGDHMSLFKVIDRMLGR